MFVLAINLFAGNGKIYVCSIEDDIDLGLAPYVKRVIADAENAKAKAVVFKINTFGGRVDAATQIKDAILNCKLPTIAFIDKRAISAGALISLSCEKIVMVPGASIGASTVVDQEGKKQAEKYQSYMRSEMRATAERNNRNPKIAEGMVDERIVIEGLTDSTKLITLTSAEALKWGIADTIISDMRSAFKALGYSNFELIEHNSNWAEDFVRFLNNPIISSLLIMIGIFGLFTEIKTPGWGVPGTAGLIALGLFFGTKYILELASMIEVLLFIAGVALLIIEIFVIPGFGFTGVIGIVCIVVSLFLGLLSDFPLLETGDINIAILQLGAAFFTALALIALSWKYLPQTKAFHTLVLDAAIEENSGYTSSKASYSELSGKAGRAFTDLRPSGTVIIDDEKIDVVTDGEFISRGEQVKVLKVEGSKIVVARKT